MCKKSLLLSFFLSGIFLSSSVHSQELDVQNYRTIDGSENNLNVPSWGAAHTNLLQVTTLGFADGFSSVGGVDRPNPREISNNIFAQDGLINDPEILSDYIWVWGQFLDHDIGFTVDGDEPLMIEIPAGDPNFDPFGAGNAIIPMRRNNFDPSTGTGIDNPRLYINEVTAYIDGSAVYGSDEECAAWLRSFSGGQLKVSAGNLLPYNTSSGEFDDEIDPAAPHMENATSISDVFFVAGDPRANENPLLVAMHTLFVREHNRECEVLARLHPDWDDEQIYQHARKMVGGKIQSIVFDEWLPAMGIILPAYEGYDPTVNAQLMNVFTAAAFRLGHTLLSSNIVRLDDNGDVIPQGNMTLREAFFNPFAIQQTGGIDPFLRGIGVQVQQAFDSKVIDDIRNFLFGQPGAGGLDLASININRGRERGLPDFNTVRADMGLEPYDFWQQINPSAAVFTRLLSTYVDINNVDPWVGMLAERKVIGSIFGETLYEIMRRQFTALRDGDRFYYWNDLVLSQEEKETIHRTSFRDIVMYNTGISRLQDDVFSAIPPNGICVNMSFDLNGQIQTVEGEPLTDVSLELSMLNGNQEQLTGPDGAYSFSDLPFCDLNVLSPYRNDDPLNGVSTFDIILISKHILGIDIITDPYDLIAGDINGNGSITTLDLVRLRKVILGIDSDFGENTSWRFVLGAYEFPDNEDPLTSDFPVSLNFQAENLADYNSGFIAIKVGDVNRSADPENFTGEEVTFRSQPLGLEIQFTDRLLRAGEEYWVDLDLIMAGELLGWQFELASDQLDLLQVDSDWPAEYYNYWDDKL
ncbi:MAG: peroxidase family protein, partial [Bacteroidota bacterium]